MESQSLCDDNMEEEEEAEYVLLDLDDISSEVHIPPNAPYVLSGLDTLNPILTIDGKIKLIGEYGETIGTCLIFNESDAPPVVHEEAGPSEVNLFPGRHMPDPKHTKSKQVKPVTQLQKILKFKLLQDSETEDANSHNRKGFFKSSEIATDLIISNILRIGKVNVIGDVILFLGKLCVSLASALFAFLMLDTHKYNIGHNKISSPIFPVLVCWFLGYVVATLFFAVVEMSIDTIILSFCQDSEEHQGTAQFPPSSSY